MEIQLYTQRGFVILSSVVVKKIKNKVGKLLLLSAFIFLQDAGLAQTTNLSFTQIPLTDPEYMRPGAGANEWSYDQNIVNIPAQGTNTQRLDRYWRFTWLDFQPGNGTSGAYNFSVFDSKIQQSISKGQTFSFGVMQQCGGCDANLQTNISGAVMLYPTWLHTQMQGESVKDFISGGEWFPNYNSPSYLTALKNLNIAINNHILNTSYNGVRYQDVIGQIDIRGYGDFGEWTNNVFTNGNLTVASGDSIISYHVHVFDKFQCVYMMATVDGGQLSNTNVPPGVGYYALTTSNSAGKLGWRRDSWGQTDNYLSQWTDANPTVFNGLSFKTEIMNRYQFAPIVGEPQDGGSAGNFTSLAAQMTKYGVTSFGNGNFNNGVNATIQNSFRAASKAAGYRIVLTGGSMTTTLTSGSSFNLSLNWQNIGAAPDYKNWNVTFELRNSSNAVVWSGTSSFNPRLFLPSGSPSAISDNFTLPSTVPQGTYGMYLIIRDPVGFRKPLPLGITGVNSDGSYLLRSNVTVGAGTGNQPPTANAGSDQTITLPTSTVSLAGSGTDAGGSIASYAWTKLSGPAAGSMATPAAASTSITGLAQGVYVFTLTVTDNQGATATDNVQITVNAATTPTNQPPVVNAGADQTIQLPTSTVSLTGTGTDADGTIASYAWTKSSGPSGGTIVTPATANTNITGLIQGVYVFTCTVTDNQGAQSTDNVQITVNAATVPTNQSPVANAGSDQTVQLPTSNTSLSGSGTDADGTIASYAWSKLSGPAGVVMATPAAATTNITGLTQGVYVFTLTVTDNQGAKTTDNIQVTVNAAVPANKPPVANAGSDFNITLPANSVTLNGSASTDPDGSIANYLWTKLSGPAISIANSGIANTVVSNLAVGVYFIQLKVTDNLGAISQDTVKIIVNAAPVNQPPVANAGADISITLPLSTVNLNGASSSDPDGTISTYVWSQTSGPNQSAISSPANPTTDVTGLVQGVYVFSLLVTDNNGATSTDVISVTVDPAANIPPVSNAGSSKSITLPTNSTTLDGSLSADPDGSISSYSWAQISGPNSSVITGGTTSSVTVSGLIAGQYTYELTVTDNNGSSAKSRVKITVSNAGIQPPVANAGADQTITLPANSATIDGGGSSASAGSIVSYVWVENSGPSTVSLSGNAQNILNNLQAGTYVFSLTVTDQNAATGTDSVRITVLPAVNKAPVANAGAGVNITLPTNSVNLDGSKSFDSDGTITTYGWTRIAGPNTPVSSGSNTSLLSLTGLVVGTYTYQLTVTDNSGASSSSRVKVIVTAAANKAPNANAGANQQITAPASTVSLNGSASNDPDGSITTYNWVTVSGPGSVTINNSNTATPSVIGLKPGGYIFELTVTDNKGATSKDQVSVTVLPQPLQANQAPVSNAGNNQTITLPVNSTVLNGSSSFDPVGTIATYSWRQVSGPSASTISASRTSTATVSRLIVGQYIFELTVSDNNGSANSDQVTVTVNPAAVKVNINPVAVAGSSDTIQLPTNTYTLNATGSTDPDGTIVSYRWQQVSGPNTAGSTSMNNSVVTVNNLQAGQYGFQVTVTDNSGLTSTATMQLVVEQAITSTQDVVVTERFTTYPNPAHDVTTLKITSPVTGTVKITIYDMNGRQVLVAQTVKTDDVVTKTLNISSLASGMYTVQITIGNKKTMVTKFIKN